MADLPICSKTLEVFADCSNVRDRVAAFIGLPNFIDLISDHVISGGTLTGLCKSYKIPYCDVVKHIDSVELHRAKHQIALNYRREHYAESVLEELRERINATQPATASQ